eukprot:scaffold41_cov370-Pavlova_lutheri.AAC.10
MNFPLVFSGHRVVFPAPFSSFPRVPLPDGPASSLASLLRTKRPPFQFIDTFTCLVHRNLGTRSRWGRLAPGRGVGGGRP